MSQRRSDEATKRRRGRGLCAAVAMFPLVFACGCAGPRKWVPTQDYNALDGTRLVHYLATVPVVTVEEATRAVVLLADGEDPYTTYEERVAELERRGVVRAAWKLQPGHTLTRGTLAFMLWKVCRMPGGANTLLFGSWGLGDRRYALWQVVDEGVLSDGSDYAPVTGGEFVAALARADSYMAANGVYESAERQIDSPADLGTDTRGGVQ